ncbi:hypothetical protein GCM10028801_15250 [Nocardioides maradonensis]
MDSARWRRTAALQEGLLTRAQLREHGINRWAVSHRVDTGRWLALTPTVISTTTGPLTRLQLMWAAVLEAGPGAHVGEITAAEVAGLRNWLRDEVTVVVPYPNGTPASLPGVVFRRSRRDLSAMTRMVRGLPASRIEPAVLLWASRQSSPRTADGIVAAVVQQRLAAPDALAEWIERLSPLRQADRFRRLLVDVAGGAHSAAELDVKRMCKAFGLAPPQRQVRRRDSSGRMRYTDCEWPLGDGRTLVLEVDGAFHMDVEHWEDDIARQRALTSPRRLTVRCTARELRDEPDRLARDLRLLGVPAA